MDRSKMTRRPLHPGELLKSGYMEPLGLSLEKVADSLKIPLPELRDFTDGKSPISVDLAMRVAVAFDTTPEFWLNAQRNLDIWQAYQGNQAWREVKRIYASSDQMAAV